ncbi:MAG TPA: phosphatidylserine/phosphatidylglycerophosphate/cardiolipin synthase family protein, partial [Propionibacteriaceae bacterium]|nr:phosphatidylserine/phosphatidylglycerophosphate/cardiolipin synthase family protein [Propionibacteriaceae bacterium]
LVTLLKRIVQAILAVQGATLLALVVVDHRRKKLRKPATFPRLPPRSVTVGSSEVTVYTYGEDLYRDMLDAISQAKSRIFFETFIWKGDAVGQAFKDALIDAANRGVKVYVVFDEFANLVVPRSFFVLPKNIAVRRHPLIASGFRFPRNTGRDHRKVLVVDDIVGFLGGYNIGSLYATDWRDTHARLTGDIVWDVQNAFIDYWNLWSGRRRAALPDFGSASWQPEIRIHRNMPRNVVYPIRGMYLNAIDRASHHIYMTHAYFIPDTDILSALIRAARRGVDVRIIIPAESNHIVADWLARGFYNQLLRNGVRLLLYQGAMVHAKTATIDGQWSTIGTANIDRISLQGNYEINMEVFNPGVARQMEEIFAIDSSNIVELTLEDWKRRHAMVKFSETVLTPLRPLL